MSTYSHLLLTYSLIVRMKISIVRDLLMVLCMASFRVFKKRMKAMCLLFKDYG